MPALTGPRKAAVVLAIGFTVAIVGMLYSLATGSTDLFGYLTVFVLVLAISSFYLSYKYDSV